MTDTGKRVSWAFEMGLNYVLLMAQLALLKSSVLGEEKFQRIVLLAKDRLRIIFTFYKGLFGRTPEDMPELRSREHLVTYLDGLNRHINEKVVLECSPKERSAFEIAKLLGLSQSAAFLPDSLSRLRGVAPKGLGHLVVLGMEEQRAEELVRKIASGDKRKRGEVYDTICDLVLGTQRDTGAVDEAVSSWEKMEETLKEYRLATKQEHDSILAQVSESRADIIQLLQMAESLSDKQNEIAQLYEKVRADNKENFELFYKALIGFKAVIRGSQADLREFVEHRLSELVKSFRTDKRTRTSILEKARALPRALSVNIIAQFLYDILRILALGI